MTPISDDIVERGAIGLDADLFVRDKYYDHPNVVRKRNDALATSRTVLTAALEGSVAVPAEPTDPMCEAMIDRIEEAMAGKGAPFQWPDVEHMYDIYVAAIEARPGALPRQERGAP